MLRKISTFFNYFNFLTTVAKNCMWWCCFIIPVLGTGITYVVKPDIKVAIYCGCALTFITVFIWALLSRWQLKNNFKNISHSFEHVHKLTHHLRDNVGKQCQPQWNSQWSQEIVENHLKFTLKRILDDGANCLTKLTDEEIVSCFLIPVGRRRGTANLVFRTVAYGGNPSDGRPRGSRDHERDVIQFAFNENEPIIHYDYEKEFQQGTFVPQRPDWKNYYMSSLMTSFSVGKGENAKKWGVLCFDSIEKNVFKEDWRYVVCAFSDAMSLVLSMQDPYADQWSDARIIP